MPSQHTMQILPVSSPVRGAIRPPGSKSLTNRALIVAALADGQSTLSGVLSSVDTRVMSDSLRNLGIDVRESPADSTMRVAGCGGSLPVSNATLWCENSGTSIRFLTALCATGRGAYVLDGNQRMRERPIGPLIEALHNLGIRAHCVLENSCPPVRVQSKGFPGGEVRIRGDLSSQYLSALLMAAPAAQGDVQIIVEGDLVSRPYIDMTLALMRDFGAMVDEPVPNQFVVRAKGYQAREFAIEPDASAASYFFGLAAITGGEVTVLGLSRRSLQGDVNFVDVLQQMGCDVTWSADSITVHGRPLHGIDIDMNAISDTAQTLACVAPFATGPTRVRNVAHMRLKETDRVLATVTELRRLGLTVDEHEDGLTIHPGPLRSATIQTYDDHRMAMSFSLIGLRQPGVVIADPGCTAKTYPNFFEDLQRLCGASP